MLLLLTILTLVPILLVAYLLIGKHMATHYSAIIGWVVMVVIAMIFFNTSFEVAGRASIHGVLSSFPISLMVLFSIFQISYMESTGCIKRISVFLKTLAPNNKPAQVMMINLSAGTTLVSVGATPVSVLPPIMKSMGYTNEQCIALPALGFDALCTYSMMAAPLVVYCDLTGTSLVDAAKVFSMYLPVVSTAIALSMFWLIGGVKMIKKGFVAALITGISAGGTAFAIAHIPALQSAIILTGVIAGIVSLLFMLLYLKATKSVIIDRSVLSEEDRKIEAGMSLGKALAPFIILIIALLIVAFVPPVDQLLRVQLESPVAVIPGKIIKLRPVWNAYFWVFVTSLISMIIVRPTSEQFSTIIKKWGKRAPKPVISTMLFFAMGYIMNFTGFIPGGGPDGAWAILAPNNNMISVLANASAIAFGAAYPLITAPLGIFAGFVTSSEASALAMFAKYNVMTSEMLGINALVVTAATGIGGGLASVISPAKLQNASATIDAIGEEGAVIKKTFKISIVLMIVVMILCFIFS